MLREGLAAEGGGESDPPTHTEPPIAEMIARGALVAGAERGAIAHATVAHRTFSWITATHVAVAVGAAAIALSINLTNPFRSRHSRDAFAITRMLHF